MTTHYLNQWWFIVNWTLRNTFQWNFIWNSKAFIQENAYENVVCKTDGHLVLVSMWLRRLSMNALRPGDRHVSVNWVIIGSANGLSPAQHQAITWINDDLWSIWPLGTNFCEIQIKMYVSDFHAPLHNIPPSASSVRSCHALLDPAAASNAFSCNFANNRHRNSIQLSNLCAMRRKSHF